MPVSSLGPVERPSYDDSLRKKSFPELLPRTILNARRTIKGFKKAVRKKGNPFFSVLVRPFFAVVLPLLNIRKGGNNHDQEQFAAGFP